MEERQASLGDWAMYMELKPEEHSNEFIIVVTLREWSDDFDPHNTKSHRNQVWMKTFTVAPPSDHSKSS